MAVSGVGPLMARALRGVLLTSRAPLADVVAELGFVQYDPIRRPARAQDLILHQRVPGYRCGDLDRRYVEMGIEENYFYTYGVLTSALRRLLYPRQDRQRPGCLYRPEGLTAEVLEVVQARGPVHPRALERHFGRVRAVNDWGGYSAVTTRALEQLHYYGLLRVARRDNGVKVFEACEPPSNERSPQDRLLQLTMRIVSILAPISESSLRSTLTQLCNNAGVLADRGTVIADLRAAGELDGTTVDGVRYVWPAQSAAVDAVDVSQRVRFLAPFDPVVWDRARFEHLWGWPYRFEAYTPPPKRQFGYYALPMFWGDRAIGWVNCSTKGRVLDVEPGFAGRALSGKRFHASFDHEVARMERMLSAG